MLATCVPVLILNTDWLHDIIRTLLLISLMKQKATVVDQIMQTIYGTNRKEISFSMVQERGKQRA